MDTCLPLILFLPNKFHRKYSKEANSGGVWSQQMFLDVANLAVNSQVNMLQIFLCLLDVMFSLGLAFCFSIIVVCNSSKTRNTATWASSERVYYELLQFLRGRVHTLREILRVIHFVIL